MTHEEFTQKFYSDYQKEYKVTPRLTTYAEINGIPMQLNELEVRYVQTLCKKSKNFKEFCKQYKIYSHSNKEQSHLMEFRPDGKFSNDFEDGFFNIADNLAFEIL